MRLVDPVRSSGPSLGETRFQRPIASRSFPMLMGLVVPRRARASATNNRLAFCGDAKRWAVSERLSNSSAATTTTSPPLGRRTRIASRSATARSQSSFSRSRNSVKEVSSTGFQYLNSASQPFDDARTIVAQLLETVQRSQAELGNDDQTLWRLTSLSIEASERE